MVPQIAVSWTAAIAWSAVTAAVGFMVSWLATDVHETAHRPYIALLTTITLLLSGAYLAWTGADTAGWTGGWGGQLMTSLVALGASLLVIAAHHFGYWDYRGRRVLPVMAGCGLLTVAFLATGSVLAPVIGHVAMHVAGVWNGIELPPHSHAATRAGGRALA